MNFTMYHSHSTMFSLILVLITCSAISKEVYGLECKALAAAENTNDKCYLSSEGKFYAENISYSSDVLCSGNCSDNDLLSWELVDSEKGILEFYFQFKQEDCDIKKKYIITLRTNEGINETSCDSTLYLNNKHSCRVFGSNIGTSINNNKCIKTVVIPFKNVFTGCYMFVVNVINGSRSHYIYGKQEYIVTDYNKVDITQPSLKPVMSSSYSNDKSEMEVKVAYPFIPSFSVMTLVKDVDPTWENHCDLSGEVHSECVTCLNKTEVFCDTSSHNALEKPPKCKYDEENGGYVCTFYNLPPTNYCIKIEFEDDICQLFTIWAPEKSLCSWSLHKVAAKIKNEPVQVAASLEPPNISAYVAMFMLIFLFASIALIMFIKKNNTNSFMSQAPSYVEEFPEVVLFYARDRPLFMDTMVQFRTVLRKMGCQIHDYWDPAKFQEVFERNTTWVNQFVSNKEVRFVIVVTPISQMLETSFISDKPPIKYKTPEPFDKMFLYMLKSLEKIRITESYKRIFVVRLQNATEDSPLTYLNPTTVYSLPANLDTLVHIIKNKPFGEFTDVPTVKSLPEVKKLFELIKDLESQSINNADYIYDIIDKDQQESQNYKKHCHLGHESSVRGWQADNLAVGYIAQFIEFAVRICGSQYDYSTGPSYDSRLLLKPKMILEDESFVSTAEIN